MNKFKAKFIRFMAGRYGVDQLYHALFWAWFVLTIVNSFLHFPILSIVGTACAVWMVFRSMSRNIVRRRAENAVFLKLWGPVKSWFILQRDKFRDRKTARYRRCRHCGAILKLPVRKGKHTVVCPKCRERFDVKI